MLHYGSPLLLPEDIGIFNDVVEIQTALFCINLTAGSMVHV